MKAISYPKAPSSSPILGRFTTTKTSMKNLTSSCPIALWVMSMGLGTLSTKLLPLTAALRMLLAQVEESVQGSDLPKTPWYAVFVWLGIKSLIDGFIDAQHGQDSLGV